MRLASQEGSAGSPPTDSLRVIPTRSGVRVHLPARGDLDGVLAQLEARLAPEDALRGRAVTVDVAGRSLDVARLREIETLILDRLGASLLQVVEGRAPAGPRPRTDGAGPARSVRRQGRRPVEEPAGRRAPPSNGGLPLDMTPTLLVRRTVRSGQRVRFNGHVVVLGDVNPGAEIVASGDIIVMGTLRGVAHAGATGAPDAQVAALRLQPGQLRVGSVIGRAPDGGPQRPSVPEVARVRDGVLVVERFLAPGGE